MDKVFPYLIAAGSLLYLGVRVLGAPPLFTALIYSGILLGCYFYMMCPRPVTHTGKTGRKGRQQDRRVDRPFLAATHRCQSQGGSSRGSCRPGHRFTGGSGQTG